MANLAVVRVGETVKMACNPLMPVVKSYEIEPFPLQYVMSWYITFEDRNSRTKFLWQSCPALDGGQLRHTTFGLKV